MSKDKFGYGTPISTKALNKNFTSSEIDYFQLEEEIGKENMQKLLEAFTLTEVKKNPNLTLSDFNEYAKNIILQARQEI
jgi:hypothetical protein